MPVALTEKAANEVKKIIQEKNMPDETMLRVGVAGGGCSGFSYQLVFDSKHDDLADEIYDMHGIKVVVDRKSDIYLSGTTVDFYDGLEKRGFVFNNPNATKTCGCGSSFSA
ncbi:MAG: iron-sulfur cluster assembly accessory protein [Planctomycetota bacterium]